MWKVKQIKEEKKGKKRKNNFEVERS